MIMIMMFWWYTSDASWYTTSVGKHEPKIKMHLSYYHTFSCKLHKSFWWRLTQTRHCVKCRLSIASTYLLFTANFHSHGLNTDIYTFRALQKLNICANENRKALCSIKNYLIPIKKIVGFWMRYEMRLV